MMAYVPGGGPGSALTKPNQANGALYLPGFVGKKVACLSQSSKEKKVYLPGLRQISTQTAD